MAVARQAEATGQSFVGVCDHIAIPDNAYAAHMTTTWYDTVATLGFLAGQTSAIHLLSVVWIAAYRHPLQTAKSFATLDHLSGGRVIFGVGAGHVEAEFEALGVDYHSRGRRLDEAIDAVRATFGTEYASFEGRYSSFNRVGIGPQPVHGGLPVWIGGSGAAAWRRVGRHGDGYIPMGNPISQFPEIIGTIQRAAEEAGRGDERFDIGFMASMLPGRSRLRSRPAHPGRQARRDHRAACGRRPRPGRTSCTCASPTAAVRSCSTRWRRSAATSPRIWPGDRQPAEGSGAAISVARLTLVASVRGMASTNSIVFGTL